MEFSKVYNNSQKVLIIDPSLIHISDSSNNVLIESKKIHITGDGSNNIAELFLSGKYTTNNTEYGNAAIHIGSFKNNSTIIEGGGIGYFTNHNETTFSNTTNLQDNNVVLYRADSTGSEVVMEYSSTIGNGITFKKYVGIAGGEPQVPLHIQSTANIDPLFDYLNTENGSWITTPPTDNEAPLSLLINPSGTSGTDGNIGLNGKIYHYSDERIKTDIEDVPDDMALSQINNIEPKYYHYKDPLRKRTNKTVGFIAQNVKQYLPTAVTVQKDFIPNCLQRYTSQDLTSMTDGRFSIVIDNLEIDLSNSTKCVRFIVNDENTKPQVLEIDCESDNKTFIFDKNWANIFVYGSQVNDVHIVDKNQIFALHHSAIQELSKQLNTKDSRIFSLEEENASINNRLSQLENAVQKLQNS